MDTSIISTMRIRLWQEVEAGRASILSQNTLDQLIKCFDELQAENKRLKKFIDSDKPIVQTQIICGVVTCRYRDEDSQPKGICRHTSIHLEPCTEADNVFVCSEFCEI